MSDYASGSDSEEPIPEEPIPCDNASRSSKAKRKRSPQDSFAEDVDDDDNQDDVPIKKRRKGVWASQPAKKRQEVTEYSQLLRTLRVEVTTDITSHIGSQPAPRNEVTSPTIGPVENDAAGEESPRRNSYDKLSRSAWPLASSQIRPPEFRFSEEIESIARKYIQRHHELFGLSDDGLSSTPDDHALFEVLPNHVLNALSTRAETLLEHSLDLLLRHRPKSVLSSQAKQRPLGWQVLLDALATTRAVDPSVLKRSHEVLDRLFGSGSRPPAHDRLMAATSNKTFIYSQVDISPPDEVGENSHQTEETVPKRKELYTKDRSYDTYLDDPLGFLQYAKPLSEDQSENEIRKRKTPQARYKSKPFIETDSEGEVGGGDNGDDDALPSGSRSSTREVDCSDESDNGTHESMNGETGDEEEDTI
ncbi:hypothetical protein FRB99_000903 [Tulasnella sp. 403]|nr:hypothetical protein FRB99_000903 [Tulasnella sp. 403]